MLSTELITHLNATGTYGTLYDAFEDPAMLVRTPETSLYTYTSTDPISTHSGPDKRIDIERIQFSTRGEIPADVETESRRLHTTMIRLVNQVLVGGTVFVLRTKCLQPPFFLRWTDPIGPSRIAVYVANYEVWHQPYVVEAA